MTKLSTFLLFQLVAVSLSWPARAEDLSPFFRQHCVRCHGAETSEAELRLDHLRTPNSDQLELWQTISDRVAAGDMPPPEEPAPDAKVRDRFLSSIGQAMRRLLPATPSLRRLNRREYEYTLQDLLGIQTSLAPLLPEDGQVQGFDNVATGLGISSILMERYLEAADLAFESAIRRIKPLPPETRRAVLMEIDENKDSVEKQKGGVIERDGAFVDFTPGWPPARIDPAHPIETGIYRCRVAVWPHDPGEHRTLSVGLFTGPLFGPGKRHFKGLFDVTGSADRPRVIEFETFLEEGHTIHILPWIYPEHVTWRDKHEARPGVAIEWVEVYGPLDQSFPSESQRRLMGDSPTLKMQEGESIYMRHRRGVKLHYVDSSAPQEDIRKTLRDFAQKAFRRPIASETIDQFVDLALDRHTQGSSFEDSVRAGVTAILCSPYFLLLNQADEVDDYTIASRLSYFLWSSMPDDELRRLAAEGKLKDPATRFEQVERMLNDPKSERFITSFTDQWLDLEDIEFTTPDQKLYPEFDDLLLRSMLAETRGFFRKMVQEDLSVRNFVDSDFAILNQRLADHYGIPNVHGHETFQMVTLPPDSIRGGLLSQASILKVTANGTTTSPVRRGAWVLDRLLGQPAPPPPPGVPAVEPDIRGATSIREQLEKHRVDASCNRCHARIDPPGFALEEFDVIGGYRQRYRSLEGKRDERVERTNYYLGPQVQSHGRLPGGKSFGSFQEYRDVLAESPRTIATAVAQKLLTYGSGRPVTSVNQTSIRDIVDATAASNYGLRSMIHAVVECELFLSP